MNNSCYYTGILLQDSIAAECLVISRDTKYFCLERGAEKFVLLRRDFVARQGATTNLTETYINSMLTEGEEEATQYCSKITSKGALPI